jgi:hypothetical protein
MEKLDITQIYISKIDFWAFLYNYIINGASVTTSISREVAAEGGLIEALREYKIEFSSGFLNDQPDIRQIAIDVTNSPNSNAHFAQAVRLMQLQGGGYVEYWNDEVNHYFSFKFR